MGENGRQVLSPSLSDCISQELCHHHWLWILFVPVLWYKKSTGVCQQDRFYTLEMREREHDRERSFILSMPLHQHSDHIAFISDLATILCLHSFSLFWFVSLHCWKQNFLLCFDSCLSPFRTCYTVTVDLIRNSLLSPLLEERILAFEKNWYFKIKQGKTTHWNGNYIFLQVHQTKLYRSVPLNLSNCWSFILHCLQLAFCAVTDLL